VAREVRRDVAKTLRHEEPTVASASGQRPGQTGTVLCLQRSAGNAAVARLVADGKLRQLARQDVTPPADAPATDPGDVAFFEWWKKIAGLEGSLADWKANPANKDDKGGETNWGITKGTFMQYHGAAALPGTDEAFAAMTPSQAMLIGKVFWRTSHAKELTNPGVAIIVADWYWGSTTYAFFRIKKMLNAKGFPVPMAKNAAAERLDGNTIDLLNALPAGSLIDDLSDERVQHYTDIAKDPTQSKYLVGWTKRAEDRRSQASAFAGNTPLEDSRAALTRLYVGALLKNDLKEAARMLNGFDPDDIKLRLQYVPAEKMPQLHQAAVEADGVGADSNAARLTL
jgi:lysozyme family protein